MPLPPSHWHLKSVQSGLDGSPGPYIVHATGSFSTLCILTLQHHGTWFPSTFLIHSFGVHGVMFLASLLLH